MDKHSVVTYSTFTKKQIRRLPAHIKGNLLVWAESVELKGIREVRKLPGYHDEPLRGKRLGQRSVKLSRAYRVIYEESESGELIVIEVKEVTKHAY